jgi:hypothetical protein
MLAAPLHFSAVCFFVTRPSLSERANRVLPKEGSWPGAALQRWYYEHTVCKWRKTKRLGWWHQHDVVPFAPTQSFHFLFLFSCSLFPLVKVSTWRQVPPQSPISQWRRRRKNCRHNFVAQNRSRPPMPCPELNDSQSGRCLRAPKCKCRQ